MFTVEVGSTSISQLLQKRGSSCGSEQGKEKEAKANYKSCSFRSAPSSIVNKNNRGLLHTAIACFTATSTTQLQLLIQCTKSKHSKKI